MRNLVTHRSPLGNVDRWFNALFQDLSVPARPTAPPVDIRQEENGYVVEVELPGLTKKDFTVDVDYNLLNTSSTRSRTLKARIKDTAYVSAAPTPSRYRRTSTLTISARNYQDGLLTV